jgi:NADH dehydrogenase FAD-containing subunit
MLFEDSHFLVSQIGIPQRKNNETEKRQELHPKQVHTIKNNMKLLHKLFPMIIWLWASNLMLVVVGAWSPQPRLLRSSKSWLSMKVGGGGKKILIVGGGIGGLSSAYDARHILGDTAEVTLVSARPTFQFTPSNPWVAVHKRTPEDITLPLKTILPTHGIQFVHGEAVHLEPKRNQLTLSDGKQLDYDYLILATGPRLAFEEIPGTGPQGHSMSICTTPHASHAADAVNKLVAKPGPVVIGAVQGASCFGPAYEFALLLNHALHKRGGKALVEKCPMTFVTSEPWIGHLGLKGAGESRKILERRLALEGIEHIVNCSVKYVTADSVHVEILEESSEHEVTFIKHAKSLKSAFTMLIPAFRGAKVWKTVPGLTDIAGMILVNGHQQSIKYPNIFSVGISVHMDALEKTPIPTGAPKTGYMIESMGTAAVKNIKTMIKHTSNMSIDGKIDQSTIELHSRPLLNGLCITDFGDGGAIFLTLPQLPPRRADVTIDGRVATLAKIAFEKYFLYKIETGDTDPYYEKYLLHLIGVDRTSRD